MLAMIFTVACFLGLSSLVRPAITLDQLFAKMDGVAKTFRSIEADLESTHVTVLVDDKNVTPGKLYYVRAGKDVRLKVELGKPVQEIGLVDKGKGIRYVPKIKQADEYSLGNKANLFEQFMALGFGQSSEELKRNYQVSFVGEETIDGKKTAMLDLSPNVAVNGLKSARLWFEELKGIALQMKTTEAGGDYTIYKYLNIKLNGTLPDSTFELKLPKDVHVNKF